MKKDLALIGGLFFVIVALLIFGRGFTSSGFVTGGASRSGTESAGVAKSVRINNFVVDVDVADSKDERAKGLSDRGSLDINRGMFFVFEKNDVYAIWMKDMKFAIDIIWIGEDKKVVDIAQNVAPEPSKKDKDLKVYTPKAKAMYVLEVNAGLTSLNRIAVGDIVEF